MKPPILSKEQVIDWIKTNYGKDAIIVPSVYGKEAQLDADVDYYEQKIREIFEEIQGHRYLDEHIAFCFGFTFDEWVSLKSKYWPKWREEMRKEIAEILKEPDIGCCDRELGKVPLANWKDGLPDQILSYQIEEIKKVRSENPYGADDDTDSFFAFDLACVKILKEIGK